jgi:long-chain acyl-CoA synthetase
VGAPAPSVEIKLVDVPEAGYHSTNPRPQGEIWIRGPGVTKGYYKNEKVTKETFTQDGWLQTGDIGEWSPKGTLSIIDRKKNLIKLAHGEYIAIEKLESEYKSCLYVHNIMVYGDSFQTKPVAVVCPVEANLRRLAEEKDLGAMSFEWLCGNKEIVKAVLQSLLAQAKKSGLKPTEMLQAVVLTPDEWTAQNVSLFAVLYWRGGKLPSLLA